MKAKSILILLILLTVVGVSAIELPVTIPSSGSSFLISGLRYEPYPVIPGEMFDLWVKVENKGTFSIANATCMLKPDYPFTLYQGELTKSYGKLNAGDAAVFQFNLKVDQNSVQGTNELQLWCSDDPARGGWKIEKIPITIQTKYPTLNIKGIKTEPSMISPGEDSTLLISIENLADSAMTDVSVKLDLSNVDIAPSNEVAEKKLRLIDASGIADIMFSIKALPNAKGGVYKVPFTLSYTDSAGTRYNQTGVIAINVGSKPELITQVDSTTIFKSNKIGEVTIKIINSGLTDLKLSSLEILPSDKFKILSNSIVYIGDIDSDDFGTATFRLQVKTSSNFDLPLKLSFRDAVNTKYVENLNVNFNMFSAQELGKKSNTGMIITILIIIAALLVIFIKRLRHRVIELIKKIILKFKK